MITVRPALTWPFLATSEPAGSGLGFVGSSVGMCLRARAVRNGRG